MRDVQRRLREAEDREHQFHQQLTQERTAASRNRAHPNDDGQQGLRGNLNNRPPRNRGLADMNLPGTVPMLPNLAQVNQGNQQNLGGRRNQPPPNVARLEVLLVFRKEQQLRGKGFNHHLHLSVTGGKTGLLSRYLIQPWLRYQDKLETMEQ